MLYVFCLFCDVQHVLCVLEIKRMSEKAKKISTKTARPLSAPSSSLQQTPTPTRSVGPASRSVSGSAGSAGGAARAENSAGGAASRRLSFGGTGALPPPTPSTPSSALRRPAAAASVNPFKVAVAPTSVFDSAGSPLTWYARVSFEGISRTRWPGTVCASQGFPIFMFARSCTCSVLIRVREEPCI